ncbi:hypothetical protein VR7878_01737 [Vibrio ruber DSM 16370]|uniref:Protoporphyrinogen oxidase n=1 Tax=Vibrio ruber (strain DSM 16370 / JCM 11486 / BCRC 17186 / CECT 7878 / LMG 23124 / VR1) TaxID=1123498 RepID=A0A1R4LIN0_VIBR1|nr:DUF6041 domain-containing protein [Vibrio ruber]SJN56368.1 hypothetical protein VR7878_01737 [Vibrio ruber DSM 16370]
MIIQRIFAVLYMLAGIAKLFPQFENVVAELQIAAVANQGTWYEGVSAWIGTHAQFFNLLSGAILFISGLVLLLNPPWTKWVIYGQLLMMVVFVTILHRSQPQVILLDAVFALAALYMLRNQFHRKTAFRPFPTQDFSTLQSSTTNQTDQLQNGDAYDVVIIGGGIAGLTAASEFDHERVLVVEKTASLGGNARHESYQGLKHPVGGVCFQEPLPDSEMMYILKKIGMDKSYRSNAEDMLVFFDTMLLMRCLGEVIVGFLKKPAFLLKPEVWGLTCQLFINAIIGKPYVSSSKQLGDPTFAELYRFLDRFAPGTRLYPQVPWSEESGWPREEMELLDNISLYTYLFEPEKITHFPQHLRPPVSLGKLVENAIRVALRVECSDLNDVSAYAGLYFLIGYLRGNLMALPGGNGGLGEGLCRYLDAKANVTMVTDTTLENINQLADEHAELQLMVGGQTIQINTRQVIWAAQKSAIVPHVPDLPQSQVEAIQTICYEDYYMASVLLSKPVLSHAFGGYMIEPEHASVNEPYYWCKPGTCLVANWMDPDSNAEVGVLSLLMPTTRPERKGRDAYGKFRSLQKQTHFEISKLLTNIGINPNVIQDIKIWHWSGGLVTAIKGHHSRGIFKTAAQPFKCIQFANQDSAGIGNIEGAIFSGLKTSKAVKQRLNAAIAPQSEASVSQHQTEDSLAGATL